MSEREHRGLFGPRDEGRAGGGAWRERGATTAGTPEGGGRTGREERALSERERRGLFGPRDEGWTGGGAWRERALSEREHREERT
jgi:hypothetical protein